MKTALSALALSFLIPSPEPPMDRITGQPFATRSEVLARNGMAATSQPLATQVALDVLKAGGTAVDAAIAANAMLCLVEPTGCGIGGDLFAIVWDAETRELTGLNGSGRSPMGLSFEAIRELCPDGKIPKFGPLPVSVPGCVDGWFALHERHGKLPMADLLAPTIRYAREGFPVSELIAYYMRISIPRLSKYPGFEEQFSLGEPGEPRGPKTGEIFRNPNLADTLEKIAEGGRDAFYKGDIARTIDAYMREHDGFLRYEDMAAHRSEWVDPVSVDYRGYRVWELPPNGQGIAALQMLNILEAYDLREMGRDSADFVHLFVEAKKLAFEDRARFYADMDFYDVPLERLLSDEYAAERRALIDMEKAAPSYDAGNASLEEGDTIYLTVADAAGNMVSLIQSNYRGMGSGMAPTGLGFVLQDRGELFDLNPDQANTYAPGKRPFHTIIPCFVTKDDEPWMSFGVMGGATQPQGHAQIVINMIDFGMNTQEAGDAPRILHQGSSQPTGDRMEDGGVVSLEHAWSDVIRADLERRGHTLGYSKGSFGGYQGIRRDPETGVYFGASESRKDGHAAGY